MPGAAAHQYRTPTGHRDKLHPRISLSVSVRSRDSLAKEPNMGDHESYSRRRTSLIEVVVVAGVFIVLTALVLPWIQASREAS